MITGDFQAAMTCTVPKEDDYLPLSPACTYIILANSFLPIHMVVYWF